MIRSIPVEGLTFHSITERLGVTRRGELRAELLSSAQAVTRSFWSSTLEVPVRDRAVLARLTREDLYGPLNYAQAARRLREWVERNT